MTGYTIGTITGYTIGLDGVVRWDSNNNVPPEDIVIKIIEQEKETPTLPRRQIVIAECDYAREVDMERHIAQYKAARANMTAEQKAEEAYERRAAFGPGEKIVDVITGETYIT